MESMKIKNSELQLLAQEIQIFAGELTKTKVVGQDAEGKPILALVNPGFLPKFHLNNFSAGLTPVFKNIEDTRIEMVKKYGKASADNPDNIQVQEFVLDKKGKETTEKTPEFLNFQKDFVELLGAEVEISYSPIPLSVVEKLEIDNFYPTLFKFVK